MTLRDDEIATGDGTGAEKVLAINRLRKVVIATDDSGPWGADVIFLLIAEEENPAALFPLEAKGSSDFVDWMSRQPGYDGTALAAAMGSTSVARFEVLNLPSP